VKLFSRLPRQFDFPKSPRRAAWAIERLEPRRLLSVVVPQPIGNQTFAQGSGSPAADLNNFFEDNFTLQQDLTFTATSDNTALVNPTISGSVLTLNVAPAGSGYAHIHVVAADPFGNQASDSFRVKITAAANRSLDVPIGPGHDTFAFSGPNHTAASITLLGPGSGTIHIGGDGLLLAGDRTEGSNQELESISLTGTTASSTLLITGQIHHGHIPMIGDISSDGPLASIHIKGAELAGDLNITGAVHGVNIDFAASGSINLGATTTPMMIHATSFADENFAAAAPVKFLSVTQWVNSDSISETFAASYVHRLIARGSFEPGLQLSGTGAPARMLGIDQIGGFVGGAWKIPGASAPLHIGGAAPDFNANIGSVQSVTVAGVFDGALTTPSLHFITIGGAMNFATLNLTAPGTTDLDRLTVRGGLLGSSITSTGNLGRIITLDMNESRIFAGIGPLSSGQSLPTGTADLSGSARIGSILVRPNRKVVGFLGSDVAATSIGVLDMGTTRTANSGVPFGVAAVQIGHLSGHDQTQHRFLTFNNIQDPATLAALIAAEGLKLGDFVIRVL